MGFIVAMWFVNCAYYHDGHFGFTISDENPFADFRFQYTDMQLLVSGITGLLLAAYSFFLPNVPVGGKNDKNKGHNVDTRS